MWKFPAPKLSNWKGTASRQQPARPCALRGPASAREWQTEAIERSRQASAIEMIVDPPSRSIATLPTPAAAAPPGNATARPGLHHRSRGIESVPLTRVVLRGACLATGHSTGAEPSRGCTTKIIKQTQNGPRQGGSCELQLLAVVLVTARKLQDFRHNFFARPAAALLASR